MLMSKQKHPHAVPQKNSWLAGLAPTTRDILSVVLIYLVTVLVFREIMLKNMAFASEGDTIATRSIQLAGNKLLQSEGEDVLWMPYFFSGMPTFGNLAFSPHDVSYIQKYLVKALNLFYLNGTWTPFIVYYFLGGVFMFLLVRHLGFVRPVALFAAFTFMLSPYAVGLAGEGHMSKLMALIYIPLIVLLTNLVFHRKDLLSFGLFAAALGTFLLTNHLQIVYYGLMFLGLYLVFRIIVDAQSGILPVARGTALLFGGLLIGICIASYIYLSVYEYAPFSIRGGGTEGATGGLTWDYATNWSWHPAELITLLIPGFFGMQVSTYWGSILPWTNSSVYVGLLPIFFAALALVYRRNAMTIFLAAVTFFFFLISLGRNLAPLYDLLFTTLPFFNKFRAPAQILHLLPLLLGILGAYGFSAFLESTGWKEEERRKLAGRLVTLAAILCGVALLALLLKSWLFDALSGSLFLRDGEPAQARQQFGQRANQAITQLKQLRFDIFWKDLVKFGVLGGVALGLSWGYLKGKLRPGLYSSLMVTLVVVDLWFVSGKYITPVPSSSLEQEFRQDATVSFLKSQEGIFRIFPVGQLFMDNTYAYHGLQSIGGYSPAKLRIYQTMIDSALDRRSDPQFPWNMSVLNMLNVRYLVVPGLLPQNTHVEQVYVDQARRMVTYRNPHSLSRAWYAAETKVASTDSEVFAALDAPDFDPSRTAVLFKKPEAAIAPQDTGRRPVITEYRSRRITLRTETAGPALLVLSEVYYPAGWKAFVDGQETEIYRTDYVLRSVVVPAGTHEVVFRFDPAAYRTGWVLSNAGWAVAGLAILLGLWQVPGVRRRLRGGGSADTTVEKQVP
jgi:Bacterial membrane protein YfhO